MALNNKVIVALKSINVPDAAIFLLNVNSVASGVMNDWAAKVDLGRYINSTGNIIDPAGLSRVISKGPTSGGTYVTGDNRMVIGEGHYSTPSGLASTLVHEGEHSLQEKVSFLWRDSNGNITKLLPLKDVLAKKMWNEGGAYYKQFEAANEWLAYLAKNPEALDYKVFAGTVELNNVQLAPGVLAQVEKIRTDGKGNGLSEVEIEAQVRAYYAPLLAEQIYRHLRPGMVGLSQVSGAVISGTDLEFTARNGFNQLLDAEAHRVLGIPLGDAIPEARMNQFRAANGDYIDYLWEQAKSTAVADLAYEYSRELMRAGVPPAKYREAMIGKFGDLARDFLNPSGTSYDLNYSSTTIISYAAAVVNLSSAELAAVLNSGNSLSSFNYVDGSYTFEFSLRAVNGGVKRYYGNSKEYRIEVMEDGQVVKSRLIKISPTGDVKYSAPRLKNRADGAQGGGVEFLFDADEAGRQIVVDVLDKDGQSILSEHLKGYLRAAGVTDDEIIQHGFDYEVGADFQKMTFATISGGVEVAVQSDGKSAVIALPEDDGVRPLQLWVGHQLQGTGSRNVTVPGRTTDVLRSLDGELISTKITTVDNEGVEVVEFVRADGVGYRRVTSGGKVEELPIASYSQRLQGVLNDTAALINALRSGQPLPQLISGLKLVNTIDAKHSIPGLDTAASIGSAALSIYNLANALKNGDALDKISATASTIYAVAEAAKKMGDSGLSSQVSDFFAKSEVGKAVLPTLNLIQSIKNNDAAGTAMSAVQLFGSGTWVTAAGWIYTIYQLSKALKDTPHAWGVGEFKFGTGSDLTFEVSGEGFGKDKVSLVMQGNGKAPSDPEYFGGLKGYLDGVIASANQMNPQEPLGLIPQRLPSLVWREAREGSPGYEVKDFDPLTGQPKRPELRYDDKFQLIQAFGTAPEDKYNLMERLITSAMERGAIAPMWEVKTAKLQEQNNIRLAGLSDIERAAREGLLAREGVDGKPSTGAFRPVALDLDGDGKITVESKAGTTRAFNWDDTGYLKASGWVGKAEGLLFLDRLPNGVVDSGVELFSNSKLADAAKGVSALAWVDANGDGRLDGADPVFNELRIWQDANADGASQSSELKKLAELGITELNYAMNRFTRNGQVYSLSSPDLETSDDGIRQSVTPEGIKVEFADGTVKVYASRVNDKSLYPGVSSIDNAATVEGGAADFLVRMNAPGAGVTRVTVGVFGGSASLSSDLNLPMQASFDGGKTFVDVGTDYVDVPAGLSAFTLRVRTKDDTVVESAETFSVQATSSANVIPAVATGTILDNDVESKPLVSISGPVWVNEETDAAAVYAITLSKASSSPVSVKWRTVDGSASPGEDYVSVPLSTVQFAPGEVVKYVSVNLINDTLVEGTESYIVRLESPVGADLGVSQMSTTIQSGDVPPAALKVSEVSATASTVAEGQDARFRVSLNQAVTNAEGSVVGLDLASSTATLGADFSGTMLVSFDDGNSFAGVSGGSVVVPKGKSSFLIKVVTLNDTVSEADERFSLGARTANDASYIRGDVIIRDVAPVVIPQATLSAAADNVSEGAGSISFTVKLSSAAAKTVTIGYGANSKTATLGTDFTVVNQSSGQPVLVFAPGETQKTFQVNIAEDAIYEGPESFDVLLTSVSDGAKLGAVTAVTTTISDNDLAPVALIAVNDTLADRDEDSASHEYSVGDLLKNDIYNRDGPLQIISFKPGNGVARVESIAASAGGPITGFKVVLKQDFNGIASFNYVVKAPDGMTAEATATTLVRPEDDPTQITFVPDVLNIYGWGVKVTKTFGGQQWNYTIEPDQGQAFFAPYETIGGRASIDYGDGSSWSNSVEDTGIPVDFAQTWINLYGYSEDNSASIDWKGKTYLISNQFGKYLHNTVLSTQISNDGHLVVSDVDAEDQVSTFRIASISVPSASNNGRVDSFSGLNFSFTGLRYVSKNPLTGDWVNKNIYTDNYLRGEPIGMSLLDVTLVNANGKTVTKTISVPHFGPPPSPDVSSGGKPIAIDLDGNGFSFTDVDDANVFFDVNGDGWRRKTAWLNPKDGFLVFDKNSDGKITDRDELSFASYLASAQSDLEGLKFFDTNKDGVFSAADDAWAKFKVWRDANSNGVTDAGELMSLESLGIAKVELESDKKLRVINGQSVLGLGRAVKTDGTSFALADVILRYSDKALVTPVGGGTPFETVIPKNQPNQTIDGGTGNDLILGGTGNDLLRGGDGNDVFNDDEGSDHVQAGAGDDAVFTGRDNDFVEAGAGSDQVFTGVGNDVVFGEEGNDTLFLEGGDDLAFGGAGNDMIAGGSGNDALSGDDDDDVLLGESGCDALFGKDGNDELRGMADGDVLYGDAGDDMLYGGAGDDSMDGGAGNDTYEVDSVKDVIVERANEGIDSVLSSIGFSLGESSNLENLTLTGEQNLDGTGNASDNRLIGNVGRNVLTALDGNDTLDGALGADVMRGGKGDDRYYVDQSGDMVEELAGEGTDTVFAKVDYTLAANVENLTLAGLEATIGTGNALDNVLTGNQWDNTLDGAAGADTLKGGLGNDTYVVDDRADLVEELAGEGFDTIKVIGLPTYTLVGNAEALVLGAGAIDGVGNELGNSLSGNESANALDGLAGDDRLYGNAGADTLLGGAGNDLLDGGDNADAMRGGSGDDQYIVQDAADQVEEAVDAGVDTVRSSISYGLTANVENLVLTGSAAINGTGNALNNQLHGNAGDNALDGAAGADEMRGGLGHDSYDVDDAGDQTLELAGQGHDQVFVKGLGEYTLQANVEDLTLGTGVLVGRGNELANVLKANDLGDTLLGMNGNDTLIGGAGNDALAGGQGDDQLAGGAGDDVFRLSGAGDVDGLDRMDGGAGSNRVEGVANAVDVLRVSSNLANLANIQLLDGGQGGSLTDVILGTEQDDVLNFSTLTVRNFVLDGGAGNDTITGTSASDRIRGGSGNDALFAGAGDDDFLLQGRGDADGLDTYDGGLGRNRILGADQVADVLRVSDKLLNLRGIQELDGGTGNIRDNRILGTEQGDTLNFATLSVKNFVMDGGDGNDTITGTAGNDWLQGGRGNDVLNGGDGDDTFLLQGLGEAEGLDQFNGGNGNNRILGADNRADVLYVNSSMSNLDKIYIIDGGAGGLLTDRIVGTTGKDFLDFSIRTVSNMVIDGGDGDDMIFGNSAVGEHMRGGRGNDVLFGGDGVDTYYWGLGDGNDQIIDGLGSSRIVLDGGVLMSMVTLQKSGTKVLLNVTNGAVKSTLSLDLSERSGTPSPRSQMVIEGKVYDLNLDTATLTPAALQDVMPAGVAMVPAPNTGLLNRWSAMDAPASGRTQIGWADMPNRDDRATLAAQDPLLHLGGPASGIDRINRHTAL